jgi:hypothetical protein
MSAKEIDINSTKYLEIHVGGAGKIRISKIPNWSTGGYDGFSFDMNWDNEGFFGGVLCIEDAQILVNYINNGLRREKINNLKNQDL